MVLLILCAKTTCGIHTAPGSALIIGIVVLAVLLLTVILIVIVVAVVYCKRKSREVTSRTMTPLAAMVKDPVKHNPLFGVSDKDSLLMHDDLNYEVVIDHNPAYGSAPEIKKKKKEFDDDHDYVVSTEEMIKTDTNPSYVPISVGDNVLDDNPSYQGML